jgi:NAD(P)-dependent dehydrogenase (short-subunit alcohol dehydrogenase family)
MLAGQKDMEALIKAAVKKFGRLDMWGLGFPDRALPDKSRLVNNAGIALEARRPGLCHLTGEEIWYTTMNVNVKSVFLGCKYGTKQMLSQELHPSEDRGRIINMSSSIMGIIARVIIVRSALL